jgi:hypothetical protein
VSEHWPSKLKALSSNPSTTIKKKRTVRNSRWSSVKAVVWEEGTKCKICVQKSHDLVWGVWRCACVWGPTRCPKPRLQERVTVYSGFRSREREWKGISLWPCFKSQGLPSNAQHLHIRFSQSTTLLQPLYYDSCQPQGLCMGCLLCLNDFFPTLQKAGSSAPMSPSLRAPLRPSQVEHLLPPYFSIVLVCFLHCFIIAIFFFCFSLF